MLSAAVFLFFAAHSNDNYSWVDRSWSILPVVYTWIQVLYIHSASGTALTNGLSSAVLFGLVVTIWGLRLTFNFYRRGGYRRGGEDYRWNYVRTWPLLSTCRPLWVFFNFAVISLFQTWLLWAITLPISLLSAAPATIQESCFAVLMLVLIALEALCDEQQWRFQCQKRRTPQQRPFSHGFCVTGVFGFCRHLNVCCEGLIWVLLALAGPCGRGARASPSHLSVGCIALEILTLFSTAFVTERLSAAKYPGYAIYQSITPMLMPTFSSTTEEVLLRLDMKKR